VIIKHSKYKNTGILFELLVRQITSDTLNGSKSPALDIIQKFFVKTELGKEYKLYEVLGKTTSLTEGKANIILQSLISNSLKLNRKILKREKYNLINEVKKHYDLEKFFKTKLPNYKVFAAFYTLTEIENSDKIINPSQMIDNKVTLLEHLSTSTIKSEQVKKDLIQEFSEFDKDTRLLTYRILIDKFNGKYSDLYESQKILLRNYIYLTDSLPVLREFYNTEVQNIKSKLGDISKIVKDKAIKIKLNEVKSLLKEIDKTQKITSEDITNLLQYQELIEVLSKKHGA